MSLYVGTSGWAYREWKPGFYPSRLPQRRFLEHYADNLSACEINATFYRLQDPATFERWSQAVPEDFRFVAKAHRRLTHTRKMDIGDDWRDFYERFVETISTFGPRLGAVLFQFPPNRSYDERVLGALLSSLTLTVPFAMEFRHPSWNRPAVTDAVASAGGTVCVAETTSRAPGRLPPGPIAYVRLRAERYGRRARARWHALLEREAEQRDVYAFTKHEGVEAEDPCGGIGLARWLMHRP